MPDMIPPILQRASDIQREFEADVSHHGHPGADGPQRILSRADSEALFKRIVSFGTGNAETTVTIRSTWMAGFRWGRNRPTTSGDTIERVATITRNQGGVEATVEVTKLDDIYLKQIVQDLDKQLASAPAQPEGLGLLPPQQYLEPKIWDDETYKMSVMDLSAAVRDTVGPVIGANLVAAGDAEVGAASWAIFNTRGLVAYAAVTGARYTETIRNLDGSASGWAGERALRWTTLAPAALSQRALRKCVASAHPVAVEPGRYTAILEPSVVCLLFDFAVRAMDRDQAESGGSVYSGDKPGTSKIGTQVFDHRFTITSDPMDPECGYIPFDPEGNPYTKVTWVENGILKALSYNRAYARSKLQSDVALPNPRTFRVSGGETSIEEMIATTDRGILVTHCGRMHLDDPEHLMGTAVTQDGLFLIEGGKMTHPIKNMWINESPMSAFNSVLQVGKPALTHGIQQFGFGGSTLYDLPVRAVCDGSALSVVPPLKVQDFNFTRITDAI